MISKVVIFTLVSLCCSAWFLNEGPFAAAAPSGSTRTNSKTTTKRPSLTRTSRSSTIVASTTTSKKPSPTSTSRSSTVVASKTTTKRPSPTTIFRSSAVVTSMTTTKRPSPTRASQRSTVVGSTTPSQRPSTIPTLRSGSTAVVPTTMSNGPSTIPTLRNSSTAVVPTCQPTWEKITGFRAFQDTDRPLEAASSSVEVCQAACLANPICQSIDFFDLPVGEVGFTDCFLYTDHRELTRSSETNHFVLTRPTANCATMSGGPSTTTNYQGCQSIWIKHSRLTLLQSSSPYSTFADSVKSCFAQCLADPDCQSIDFYNPPGVVHAENTKHCYMFYTQGPSGLISHSDFDHYDVTRPDGNCAAPSQRPSTIPTLWSSSTAVVPICQPTWNKTSGFGAVPTIVQPLYGPSRAVEECQAACIVNPDCHSIDYTKSANGRTCKVYTDRPRELTSFDQTDHYALTRPNPSNCGCQVIWKKYSGLIFLESGYTFLTSARTVEWCQADCLATPSCRSIDFYQPHDFGEPTTQCYLLIQDLDPTGLVSSSDGDHYELTRPYGNCATTPSG